MCSGLAVKVQERLREIEREYENDSTEVLLHSDSLLQAYLLVAHSDTNSSVHEAICDSDALVINHHL